MAGPTPDSEPPYRRAHISEVPSLASDLVEAEWKPVRYHFGISGFGVNGYVAQAEGEVVVEEHADSQHEELYVVVAGTARFSVAGDAFEASAGTLASSDERRARGVGGRAGHRRARVRRAAGRASRLRLGARASPRGRLSAF